LRSLVEKKNLEKLKNVLKYEGAFAVSELPPDYITAFRSKKDADLAKNLHFLSSFPFKFHYRSYNANTCTAYCVI
jgi:hypothetical protein